MSTPEGAPSNPSNPFADAAAATRSMLEANTADTAPTTEHAQTPVTAPEGTTTSTPVVADATPPPLSWDAIDLSVLPEEAQKVVRDGYLRHSDYTRKTQELAEQRKQIEQYGDPETVSEAMAFVQNLQDPDFLVQLKSDIESHLAAANGGTAPSVAVPPTDQTSPGLDPATLRDIQEIKEWKAQQAHAAEEAALVQSMETKLQTDENAIRADYPYYTQDDINTIYSFTGTPDVGYDLFKAREKFEAMEGYFQKKLIGNKDQIPGVANNVRSDAIFHSPNEMNDFKSAKDATAALFAAAE